MCSMICILLHCESKMILKKISLSQWLFIPFWAAEVACTSHDEEQDDDEESDDGDDDDPPDRKQKITSTRTIDVWS